MVFVDEDNKVLTCLMVLPRQVGNVLARLRAAKIVYKKVGDHYQVTKEQSKTLDRFVQDLVDEINAWSLWQIDHGDDWRRQRERPYPL